MKFILLSIFISFAVLCLIDARPTSDQVIGPPNLIYDFMDFVGFIRQKLLAWRYKSKNAIVEQPYYSFLPYDGEFIYAK
ncbi:hypothetical protein PVAND_012308 [Polypedilum vanderplanki]|uniref:Uncharacterized protein n=1 Tax=Polypedilum vanderplanki TaxID=319348 RepID=A0A9J6CM23_POLVA|nr:hypothetical protein PVAND_012308 [Polypedilum vanderplanki]